MARLSFTHRCLQGIGKLPLPVLHALGGLLGWLVFLVTPRYRKRLMENIRNAQLGHTFWDYTLLVCRNVRESGKAVLELLAAWSRQPAEIAGWTRHTTGWEIVEKAQQSGKGILFVTPHLGAYEIGGHFLASRLAILAMFKPPKLAWLAPLMMHGREKKDSDAVSADAQGVRKLLRTLKNGGSTMILPDQVPGQGDGEWVPFFGRPAYTMTLVPRLAVSTGAEVILFYAERLAWGRGFVIHFASLPAHFSGERVHDVTLLNQAVEQLVRRSPEQYLWSYNRYKTPANAPTRATSDNA
ncbi:lysophospholipid acyltransferase family protein [Leeia oryzae]|uniref:lysophospholipid acyltransferase family protein n=1 Tax=Leeia oryzae TaxID=356662 RepID=UPI00037F9F65|nr:lysophospholipid acyltransferase family protein [Leeia oryzae]